MTDQINYPMINGYRFSWASIGFAIQGVEAPGIKEINYKAAIQRSKVRGAGRRILGYTKGNIDYDSSITFLKDEYVVWIAQLGSGYMDAVFPITVRYEEGVRVHNDLLKGCRLGEEDHAHSQSTDGLEVKCKLDIMFYTTDKIAHILGR